MKEKEKKLVGSANKVRIYFFHLNDQFDFLLGFKERTTIGKNGENSPCAHFE